MVRPPLALITSLACSRTPIALHRAFAVALSCAALAAVAHAVPRRILHEPLPAASGAELIAPRLDALVAASDATAAAQAALPAAIRTASGLIAQPEAAKPGDKTPTYQPRPPPRVGVDRRTGADLELHYQVVFDPSVAPFKRDHAFDAISADGTLGQHQEGVTQLPVGGDAQPGRELFWGHVRVQLQPGVRTPLPSVAPDSRILRYQTEPKVDLSFWRDAAGNQFVLANHAGELDLRWLTDAPSTYFAAPLGAGEPPADAPSVAPLDPGLQRRMAEVWPALGVRPDQARADQLRTLVQWFRSFEPGQPPPASDDPLRDLVVAQKGVCRHRALGFVAVALSLGIPAHYVMNDAHAFVEVWAPLHDGSWGWQRVDLGGGSDSLELHAAENKRLHQPLYRDPFPRPASYASASGQVLADGQPVDQVWGGAAEVKGRDQMANVTPASYDASEGSAEAGAGRSNAAAGAGQAASASGSAGAGGSAQVLDDARRTWLRQRAQSIAGAPRPPTPAGSPAAPVQTETRDAVQVQLALSGGEVWAGEPVAVQGTVRTANSPVARVPVEIWLVDPRQPLQAQLLGALVTDAQGRYAGALRLPVGLAPAAYDLVARFAGTAALAPADSEQAAARP